MTREIVRALMSSFVKEPKEINPIGERKAFIGTYIENINDVSPVDLSKRFIVVEPYEHVGFRPQDKKGVTASENIAWIIHQITNAETYIIPAWKVGVKDKASFAAAARGSLGTIFEGGDAVVHKPATFTAEFKRSDATRLLIEMMLAGSPFLSICLSHQLTAHAHVKLIREAVEKMIESDRPPFVEIGKKIKKIGESIIVLKKYGQVAADWTSERFASAPNEEVTCGDKNLYPYLHSNLVHVPAEVNESHRYVAELYSATIDTILQQGKVKVQAFHGNEVAEEAMQFVCWAYQNIHRLIIAYRTDIASDPNLSSLLSAPLGLEITSSTRDNNDEAVLCEVASTAIYWIDRMAQTMQFHPELDVSLKTASEGWAPTWREMKDSEGIRLFVQMLISLTG